MRGFRVSLLLTHEVIHAGAADIVVGAARCYVVSDVIEAEVLEEGRACVDGMVK